MALIGTTKELILYLHKKLNLYNIPMICYLIIIAYLTCVSAVID